MQPWRRAIDLTLLTVLVQSVTWAWPLENGNELPVHPRKKTDSSSRKKQISVSGKDLSPPLASYCSPAINTNSPDCSAPKCTDDVDCNRGKDVCCHNGCVYTCMPRFSPPLVLDWEEDLDVVANGGLPVSWSDREGVVRIREDTVLESGVKTSHVLGSVGRGDCELTQEEFVRVEAFQNNNTHVKQCFCENGQVLCQVASRAGTDNSPVFKSPIKSS